MKKTFLILLLITSLKGFSQEVSSPNIILIVADDAGIGDYEPYNTMFSVDPAVKLKTPNIKKLSEEGMLFTSAYSTGAVCQPSRYSIMTGLYPIRKVISGTTSSINERIIPSNVETIGQMLKKKGYQTAMFGKWHLDYLYTDIKGKATTSTKNVDLSQPIPLGVNQYGFDYSFWLPKGVSGADFFIENNTIVKLNKEVDYKGSAAWEGHKRWEIISYKSGEPLKELNKHVLGDAIVDKALDYMEKAVQQKKPFFIYLPLIAPHTPHLPNRDVNGHPVDKGTFNSLGQPADRVRQKMVYENDVITGQILEQLDRLKISDNTIVIFTSDNGGGKPGAVNDGASGIYKGYKGTAWEGGTRMPLIVKWPNKIKKASINDALVSQVDFYATFAALLNVTPNKTKDSKSFLPVLLGKETTARNYNVTVKHKVDEYANEEEGIRNIGMRTKEGYKLILFYNQKNDTYEPIEFYNLNDDASEKNNLIANVKYKSIINEMKLKLEKGILSVGMIN
ncbi:Arylsulfatase A [Flavobacterium flevense]|uniref:Arylsulfatase n=1 Tax=Flavobacterium flevense TaxID=983 RepID=A0A4Y4AWZ9_9FLAO|nr:sulfatase-like hydrolase/transferase [Flavobacterium flevense]GEC72751.1 arylsulfatase [Flavobacterium flevense]SHM16186.1 Arylsulfatase A [Flavobacterium flevense]